MKDSEHPKAGEMLCITTIVLCSALLPDFLERWKERSSQFLLLPVQFDGYYAIRDKCIK